MLRADIGLQCLTYPLRSSQLGPRKMVLLGLSLCTLKYLMEGVVLDHFDLEALMKKAHELGTKQSDTVQKAEKN